MSDDEDLVDDIDTEEDTDAVEEPILKVLACSSDARRKLETKLEEMRLRKMTQEYDF